MLSGLGFKYLIIQLLAVLPEMQNVFGGNAGVGDRAATGKQVNCSKIEVGYANNQFSRASRRQEHPRGYR